MSMTTCAHAVLHERHEDRFDGIITWQVPWVELVDVDLGDDGGRARRRGGALAEVVEDELLVCWVETEPRRQRRARARHAASASSPGGR